jgi:hypothetical protein
MSHDNGLLYPKPLTRQKRSRLFKALHTLAPPVLFITLILGTAGYLLGIKTSKTAPQGPQQISFQPTPAIYNPYYNPYASTVNMTNETEKTAIRNTPILKPQDFTYLLEVPDEVPLGASVPIRLKVKNISNQALKKAPNWGDDGRVFFIVAKRDGTEIYRFSSHYPNLQIEIAYKFEAGEERVFEEKWDQIDNDGAKVPPGIYIVQIEWYGSEPSTRQLTILRAKSL